MDQHQVALGVVWMLPYGKSVFYESCRIHELTGPKQPTKVNGSLNWINMIIQRSGGARSLSLGITTSNKNLIHTIGSKYSSQPITKISKVPK